MWTFEEAGEEIPCGDPSVTDAERAAAGRETIAGRWRALLAGNRSRAAARYAAGVLPDGQDVVRVWQARDPAELRDRLAGPPLAVWAEGDILHVLWQGQAEEVQLGAGVQPRLWPVAGADDLWEASLRIRRLQEAVITIAVMPRLAGGDWPAQLTEPLVWRGPRAPAAVPARRLRGTVEEHTLDSAALGAPRRVTVYRPPGPARARPAAGRLRACGRGIGIRVRPDPGVRDPGRRRPAGPAGRGAQCRQPSRFLARPARPGIPAWRQPAALRRASSFRHRRGHSWSGGQFGPAEGPWVAAGFSNGGAWAIAAAQRRPDLLTAVAAFSSGVVPQRISREARSARIRHYLAAGTLEPGFRRATRQWAQRLQRAGLPCRHEEWIGGHDHLWWEQQLPIALGWLLAPP